MNYDLAIVFACAKIVDSNSNLLNLRTDAADFFGHPQARRPGLGTGGQTGCHRRVDAAAAAQAGYRQHRDPDAVEH
jgi:hypothetical protein